MIVCSKNLGKVVSVTGVSFLFRLINGTPHNLLDPSHRQALILALKGVDSVRIEKTMELSGSGWRGIRDGRNALTLIYEAERILVEYWEDSLAKAAKIAHGLEEELTRVAKELSRVSI